MSGGRADAKEWTGRSSRRLAPAHPNEVSVLGAERRTHARVPRHGRCCDFVLALRAALCGGRRCRVRRRRGRLELLQLRVEGRELVF